MCSGLGQMLFRLSERDYRMRGLHNHHLCCCVNTLLQSFSATWELAELLERWESSGVRSDSRNVPLQLKRLLAVMSSDLPQPAPHNDFLQCLDRNRIRLSVQHDADEVFLSILNLLQQQIDDRALADELQNLYKISVETHLKCTKCASVQAQTSYMLSLPLNIKEDDNSLESCLVSFFKHHELTGRDCCYCDQCETKTPSLQATKLLSLPHILCINLKRFRVHSGRARKLDCRVTFRETIDLSEIVKDEFSSDFTQSDCRYTLYAVVVHSGFAMFGHYTAFVRHRVTQHWYYADDGNVKQASWEAVKTAYGGHNRLTAYMLMYRRGSKEEVQQPEFSG